MRVLLILVDGMRPDAIADIPYAQTFIRESASTMAAETVFPSVTLPCHMSLFHSVDPSRHGTTTNTHAPQVRPIDGLCEVLNKNKKTCAFFYDWEQLKDLARPGSLTFSWFMKGKHFGWEAANNAMTQAAMDHLLANETDFAFLYLAYVDEAGHAAGWMSPEYMHAIQNSWDNIQRIVSVLPEDYTVIVTADHGGHDRTHGTQLPEDMTIPMMIRGKNFVPGSHIEKASIKDIAPTVVKLLGTAPAEEWEGTSLA